MEYSMEHGADVHLTLPEGLVATLDRLATTRGVRRAHLVREALVEYVSRAEAARIDQEIQEYVNALGPYSDEFVREHEEHTLDRLLRETEW